MNITVLYKNNWQIKKQTKKKNNASLLFIPVLFITVKKVELSVNKHFQKFQRHWIKLNELKVKLHRIVYNDVLFNRQFRFIYYL